MRPIKVGVMGGSLVGLTTALVLRDVGCDVDVYERSEHALEGRGVGIVLHAMTLRYLLDNDVLDVDRVGTRADIHRYLDQQGHTLTETHIEHRFTGYNTLHRALLGAFGMERYHLGREVVSFEQDDESVAVTFADGAVEHVDLLVAADGIRSRARSLLLPDVHAQYAGYVAWRAVVDERDLSEETYKSLADALTYFVRPNSHALVYAIPNYDGSVEPGTRLQNIVWYRNVETGEPFEELLIDRDGHRRELSLPPGMVQPQFVDDLHRTAQAQLPPQFAEVVTKASEPFLQALFDVDIPRMAFGRICLVGDAAFAVRPHAAAATAKGASDAWALAEAIAATEGDVPAALARWEPGQLEIGRNLLYRNRDMGTRSQFENTWRPGDPSLAFGLLQPGDSASPAGKRI
jgi:2,6-dihydroxypyridine 3-monooxygenase